MRYSGGGQLPEQFKRFKSLSEQFSRPIVLIIRRPMRVAPFRGSSGDPMCDKCVELDKKIERYRRLSSSLADQITIDRIKALIDELHTQKVELHPEQKS